MLRKFKFEDDIYVTLSCLPMAARRKLDAVGLRIGRVQWAKLGRGEKLMICHAPANSPEEIEVLRLFVQEAVATRTGTPAAEISTDARAQATPPRSAPSELVRNAHALGVQLTDSIWTRLDADERYALVKLGGTSEPSHNLGAALSELVSASTD